MNRTIISGLGAVLVAISACGDEDDDVEPRSVSISFAASVGGLAASCSTVYDDVDGAGTSAQLADARLFVSGIELRNARGEWVALGLDGSRWQHQGVALLDFEDGADACAGSGTSDLNDRVTGVVPPGSYDGLRYDVGIPFELNHNDQATAPAPFNTPGMFWNWRGGYKFVRVDWVPQSTPVERWNVHLGSVACDAPAPTQAPAAPCGRPNLPRVELDRFDPDADLVEVDLGALVRNANLSVNVPDSPPGCMSSPMEADDCTPVYSALGLDFAAGTCADDCAGQAVFAIP